MTSTTTTTPPQDPSHEEHQYLSLIRQCLSTGEHRPDRTGTGTYSLFAPLPLKFSLTNPTTGAPILPLLTTKRVFLRAVIAELLWFITGSTSTKPLSDQGIKIWDGNGSKEYLESIGLGGREDGDLGPVYGFQWRHFGAEYDGPVGGSGKDYASEGKGTISYEGKGVDQLAGVVERLKEKPYDRRILMCAWNPKDMGIMALPPCHVLCQFYVSFPGAKRGVGKFGGQAESTTTASGGDVTDEAPVIGVEENDNVHDRKDADGQEKNTRGKGVLHCQLYQRSCDMGLGVPFNIASYALLTHMLAHACDLTPGTFTHVMGDAHVYADHVGALEMQVEREPRQFPTLEIVRGDRGEGNVDGWKVEDFVVKGYEPHKGIVMKMSV